MLRIIFSILGAVLTLQAFSTKGPYFFSSKSGNVETQIVINDISSFEIEKTALVGKICDFYIQNSEFKNVPVYIFYLCSPCGSTENSKYFLSYDRGDFQLKGSNNNKNKKLLPSDGIIIRICSNNINPRQIVKLLEFGLDNIHEIKKNQKKISQGYWRWNSIDSLTINSIINSSIISNKITTVLESNYAILSNLTNLNVVWCNEQYQVCDKNNQEFLNTNNLSLIIKLDSINSLIFDSPKSFFFVNSFTKIVSQKQALIDNNDCFRAIAIKTNSEIFITNYSYHNSLINVQDFHQFNIWRLSIIDFKIENIPFTIETFYKIFNSISNQRSNVDIDIKAIK
jgi:hypothetical protein